MVNWPWKFKIMIRNIRFFFEFIFFMFFEKFLDYYRKIKNYFDYEDAIE